MFSKKKTTDLFEALPPSSASQASSPSNVVGKIVEKAKDYKRVDVAEPQASKKRIIEDDEPVKTPLVTKAAAPERTRKPVADDYSQKHTTLNSSSNSQLYIVLCVFACFSVATGLMGYVLGKKDGYKSGAEDGVNLRAKKQIFVPTRKFAGEKPTNKPGIKTVGMKKRTSITDLPLEVDKLSPEQAEVVKPKPKKRYTIQIQTFGRNHVKSAHKLVGFLQNQGIEAFIDTKTGVVYAGRFEKINSSTHALQKRISRLNWNHVKFQDTFFNRIPTSLLKDGE
jgi:hypothetical protein